jgi:hypothetical protein
LAAPLVLPSSIFIFYISHRVLSLHFFIPLRRTVPFSRMPPRKRKSGVADDNNNNNDNNDNGQPSAKKPRKPAAAETATTFRPRREINNKEPASVKASDSTLNRPESKLNRPKSKTASTGAKRGRPPKSAVAGKGKVHPHYSHY